jgi:hypothetical protein
MKELEELRHPKLVATPIAPSKVQQSPMPTDRYYENGICLVPKRKYRRRIRSLHEMDANKENNSSYSMESYLSNISETGEHSGQGVSISMIKGDANASNHVLTVDSVDDLSLLSKSRSPMIQSISSIVVASTVEETKLEIPDTVPIPCNPLSATNPLKKNNVVSQCSLTANTLPQVVYF